jgi:predicted MFS family arabinose efflux permease
LTALLLAMSEGQDWGWTGYRVLTLVAVGVNCLALFVVVELQRAEPLLDVRVFRHPRFANALFLIMIVSISLVVTLYYIPLFLQDGQNLGAFDTGLVIVPQALVMLVMMPLAGRLYDLVGARIPAVVGMALNGIGTLLMCDINADVTHGQLIWWTIVRGFGMSLSTMPIMTGGIGMLPPEQVGLGSTFNNVILRAAPAFGLAALTAIVTRDQTQHLAEQSSLLVGFGPTEDPRILAWQHSGPTGLVPLFQRLSLEAMAHSYSTAFLVMGLLCLVGAALALLLPHGAPTRSTSTGPVEL